MNTRWDREQDVDMYHCTVLVGGRFVVYERTYSIEPMSKDEDTVRDEFLAEFAEKVKNLLASA